MTADIMKSISVTQPGIPIKVPAVQGDSGRRIIFVMADLDIPSGSTATIYAKKPSGAEIYNSCTVSQSASGASTVTVDLTSTILGEPGEIPAQIQVTNGNDIVTTFLFFLCVQKSLISNSAIEGKDEFTALEQATQAANEAAEGANTAKGQAETAAQAANTAAGAANSAAGAANTAKNQAETAAQAANTAAQGANAAKSQAETAAQGANAAKSQAETAAQAANEAAEAANEAAAGDISNKAVTFQQAAERANINTGESTATLFGKIKKWLADLGAAAFQAVANNCTTNVAGSVLDARQGKELQDQVDQLNTKMLVRTLSNADITRPEVTAISGQVIRQGKLVIIDCSFTTSSPLGGSIWLIVANGGLPTCSSLYSVGPFAAITRESADGNQYTGLARLQNNGIIVSVRNAETYCFHLEYFTD